MSNLALVAELMDHWFREENYALTKRIELQDEALRTFRVANTLLTQRCQELAETLRDQQEITDVHVDLNFRMQERIDYLELLLLRRESDIDVDETSSDEE